ncbi:MAG TPA: type II toxin-antitoxin system MqsA family antitoxin [Gemmataceae bacterium]|nr:type II toxin-antitoxin system MqsA family antitoxin [Gemmataceae bacterium]
MTHEQSKNAETRCPVCGAGKLKRRVVAERFEYEGDRGTILVEAKDVPIQVCDACGETFSGPPAAQIRHDAICRALKLLTPEEIKSLRERLGKTQQEFAELTGIGEATISRWERGRLLQNRANDNFLRLIAGNPGNLKLLQDLRVEVNQVPI